MKFYLSLNILLGILYVVFPGVDDFCHTFELFCMSPSSIQFSIVPGMHLEFPLPPGFPNAIALTKDTSSLISFLVFLFASSYSSIRSWLKDQFLGISSLTYKLS